MLSISQFRVIKVVGEGGFGQILLAKDQRDELFAIKQTSKKKLFYAKKENVSSIENAILSRISFNYIVRKVFFFEDRHNYYLGLEYYHYGNILKVLNRDISDKNMFIKKIFAQLLETLSFLHNNHVIHRDIKPENMLVDDDYNLKLCDFGSALYDDLIPLKSLPNSFAGTPDYIPPEVIGNELLTPAIDLWGFGCSLYFIYTGICPFHSETNFRTFEQIKNGVFKKDMEIIPNSALDLITNLLITDPTKRLGYGEWNNGYPSLLKHEFFVELKK